ncbi:MAG: hypothetical protein EOP10_16700 [Proteobacteria bacterium]|nr:MAG: hypothetical protein EOP10_16700 [Pseudomonadota bacterium]
MRISWTIGLQSLLLLSLQSCAVLHRVQLSDVENTKGGEPLSIKASETTVDFREAGSILKAIGKSKSGAQGAGDLADTYAALFQYGPRTGTPVFNDEYARNLAQELFEKCKGGHLSNIISVRETRSYPVIKGEIVRIDAICTERK